LPRETTTSTIFQPALPNGRVYYLSAMVATFGTPTVVFLAELSLIGHYGTSRMTRKLLSISRAGGVLMDGTEPLQIWIS
jgi:hypothetical protein